MDLGLAQEARRALSRSGTTLSYEELTTAASQAPAFKAFIDHDDERFLRPGDLPVAVAAVCAETSQPVPRDAGSLMRVLLESLALKYAAALRQLELATGTFERPLLGSTHAGAAAPPTRTTSTARR